MASSSRFTPEALDSKLKDLNATLQSIQGVSQWLMNHAKYAKTIVGVWFREMQKAKVNRKLTLLYLANDIVQNSKRKGPEFKSEFAKALPRALHLVAKEKSDDGFVRSVARIIDVWNDRRVFDSDTIEKFRSIIVVGSSKRSKSDSDLKTVSPPEAVQQSEGSLSPPPSDKPPNDKQVLESDALLKMIVSVEGENSSAEDMATRQKIASFPSELYNVNIMEVKDKEAGQGLLEEVDRALKTLSEYTERMEKEEKERRNISEHLDTFIWHQQNQLHAAKVKQKEYQQKTERCAVVREVLKSHIAALPNLATPSSKRLAPLPSAGDLFS